VEVGLYEAEPPAGVIPSYIWRNKDISGKILPGNSGFQHMDGVIFHLPYLGVVEGWIFRTKGRLFPNSTRLSTDFHELSTEFEKKGRKFANEGAPTYDSWFRGRSHLLPYHLLRITLTPSDLASRSASVPLD
jgi:hypothetical protein